MSTLNFYEGGMKRVTDWSVKPFYKAFIQMKLPKADGKKEPIGEYTRTTANHCALDEVQRLRHYMGILAPNTVLLDADSEPHSENLLKLIQGEHLPFMVTSRDGGRGVHALFVDDDGLIKGASTHVMLACGIIVDIKAGCKNGLECLKFNGTEREIVYDADEYGQIPKYFTPITSTVDFASLGEGDGRNQALFNYILTLQANDFTNEEARECIRVINKYVLKTPLSDDEIDTITREAAFTKPVFFKKNVFLHDKFAEYLKRKHHIKKINGQLHFYNNGTYVCDLTSIERLMIVEIANLTDARRKEVLKYLNIACENVLESNVNLIAFRNGVYNIDTGELSPCSPDVIITNCIPWDYNPNAYDERLEQTLNKLCCDDAEIRALLEEMIGACFYRSNTLGGGKAFVLRGGKENGKSTLLSLVKVMLGKNNVSDLDLKNIDDHFKTIRLFGKLANIGNDISDEFKSDPSTFKKIVTGDAIEVEQKGQPGFSFEPYTKLIFSANTLSRIKDPTGAVQRRLIIIPFNAKFSETDSNFDPQITFKLKQQSVIEYLIRLGIEGLKRVLVNKRFGKSSKVQAELNEYERYNNPIILFIEELGVDAINGEPTRNIYKKYCEFCITNGFKDVSLTKLTQDLKEHGFVVITTHPNGKSTRTYQQERTL